MQERPKSRAIPPSCLLCRRRHPRASARLCLDHAPPKHRSRVARLVRPSHPVDVGRRRLSGRFRDAPVRGVGGISRRARARDITSSPRRRCETPPVASATTSKEELIGYLRLMCVIRGLGDARENRLVRDWARVARAPPLSLSLRYTMRRMEVRESLKRARASLGAAVE